jgi:hypothetical protein
VIGRPSLLDWRAGTSYSLLQDVTPNEPTPTDARPAWAVALERLAPQVGHLVEQEAEELANDEVGLLLRKLAEVLRLVADQYDAPEGVKMKPPVPER